MGSSLLGKQVTSSQVPLSPQPLTGKESYEDHSWLTMTQTLVSEIFPLSIRARGASIGASSNWVNNFAIALFVPSMFAAWAWGTYIFFAVFLAGGFVRFPRSYSFPKHFVEIYLRVFTDLGLASVARDQKCHA